MILRHGLQPSVALHPSRASVKFRAMGQSEEAGVVGGIENWKGPSMVIRNHPKIQKLFEGSKFRTHTFDFLSRSKDIAFIEFNTIHQWSQEGRQMVFLCFAHLRRFSSSSLSTGWFLASRPPRVTEGIRIRIFTLGLSHPRDLFELSKRSAVHSIVRPRWIKAY